MTQLAMPTSTRYPLMPTVRQEVYINGARRTDLYCLSCSLQSGGQPGTAEIGYSPTSSSPYAPNLYDAALLLENDAFELRVAGYGTIFRGFIASRESNVAGNLIYRALDITQKLNDCFFKEDYGQQDAVVQDAIIYPWTAAQIAARAWQLYVSWRMIAGLADYPLTFDLATFPAIYAGPQALRGQPLLIGLGTMLNSIDFRLRVGVRHANDASTVFAYYLGYGPVRRFVRGVNREAAPENQPTGPANVGNSEKSVSAENTISHVQAEGDGRIIESSFALVSDWGEVPDVESIPEGANPLDYLTTAQVNEVINNWEKYTTEKLDLRAYTGEVLTVGNPYYRKKYELACTRFMIPLVNDLFYPDDDDEQPLDERSMLNRRLPLATNIVQSWQGRELDPFIVYKRVGDANYYARFDGFTIKDHTYVEFQKPFVDTVSRVLAKGGAGAFVPDSWASGESKYTINDATIDLTEILTAEVLAAGTYLYLGEIGTAYLIKSADTAQTMTVYGNVTGAGGESAGGDWAVLDLMPFMAYGTAEVGGLDGGRYQILSGGDTTLTNEVAGMYLVLGNFSHALGGFQDAPGDCKIYRISYNSDSVLYLDNGTEDLTGASTTFCIMNPRQESFRQFEAVYLNAAYQSAQKLVYQSADLSALRGKRIVHKQNNEYQWRTLRNYWQLLAQSGDEDQFVVTYSATAVDAVKQQAALGAWALQSVGGAAAHETQYSLSLPFMELAAQVGDRVTDNNVDTLTSIVNVEHDFERFQTIVRSSSF